MYILVAEFLKLLKFVQLFEPVIELFLFSGPLPLHEEFLLIFFLDHAIELLFVEILNDLLGDGYRAYIELGLGFREGDLAHRRE